MIAPRTRQLSVARALVASVVVAALFGELRAPLNGDAHWIMTMATRVLDGERLYRDILEINPPLIVWLQMPLVWLARLLHLSPATLYRTVIFALAFASTAISYRLIARSALGAIPRVRRFAVPVMLAAFLLIPSGAFGQREQVISMLLLPLVLMTALRIERVAIGAPGAIGIGVAAGLAIALKPHFIVVWVLLAALRTARARQARIELEDIAITFVGVAYVAAVVAVTPGFFGVVATFGGTYVAFTTHHNIGSMLANAAVVWLAAALVAWIVRMRGRREATGPALALAGVGALLAALLQGKGWSYHFLPVVIVSVLLGAVALAGANRLRSRTMAAAHAVAAALLLFSWIPLGERVMDRFRSPSNGGPDRLAGLAEAVSRESGARTILVLAADMTSALPWIADAGLVSHSSFPYLWVPAVMYHTRWNRNPQIALRSPAMMGRAERAAHDAVVADFVRRTPDILVVESRSRNAALTGYPGGFDHLAYYGQDPAFTRCLREFRLQAELTDYVVFRRVPPTAGTKECADAR